MGIAVTFRTRADVRGIKAKTRRGNIMLMKTVLEVIQL
jgi:hypothetical protein